MVAMSAGWSISLARHADPYAAIVPLNIALEVSMVVISRFSRASTGPMSGSEFLSKLSSV